MEFRYDNIILKRMKKITRIKNRDGNLVIYVQECDKYKEREWKTRNFEKTLDK
jgi:hypothetical protein